MCESSTTTATSTANQSNKTGDIKPEQSRFRNFLNHLQSRGTKPVIFFIVEPFASFYIPQLLLPDLPIILSSLYEKDLSKKDIAQLLKLSEEKIQNCHVVNEAKQVAVEKKTRKQRNARIWFRM